MPTYVYKCIENGKCTEDDYIFEKKQRFSDPPVAECPRCGGAVRKVINSVGVVFKGSGFYVTDNRGSNSAAPSTKKSDGGDSNAKTESASSSAETKSESTVSAKKTEKKATPAA